MWWYRRIYQGHRQIKKIVPVVYFLSSLSAHPEQSTRFKNLFRHRRRLRPAPPPLVAHPHWLHPASTHPNSVPPLPAPATDATCRPRHAVHGPELTAGASPPPPPPWWFLKFFTLNSPCLSVICSLRFETSWIWGLRLVSSFTSSLM
jgi:hypothetical protein